MLTLESKPTQSDDSAAAEATASAEVTAAIVVVDFSKSAHGEISLDETVRMLKSQVVAVHRGNLQEFETMLVARATASNAIFGELTRRSALNMGEYLDAADRYSGLALKTQGQCRATLDALATVENPPVLFARQANIANGPQQVNNAAPAAIFS